MTSMTVQQFMQIQLLRRQEKNAKFSLRSFARLLETDPSSLSKVLNGLRIPSEETIEKWVSKLKLSDEEAGALRGAALNANAFNPLSCEFFESTYSWVHPILLESMKLPNSLNRITHLAKYFGMTPEQLQQTIEFLAQNKILYKNPQGQGYLPTNLTTIPIPYTTNLRRNLQKKYLQLALNAVEEVPFEKRDNSTLTVAVHSDDLPAIRDIIREAQNKINKLSEKRKDQVNTVYNFSSALYPVIEESHR
ncbi:TIGR02147 family protein [Bdellovibrio svalbardensis]|uniref:TIGR02147 family protein n=1 Tax=Bdellovibrio svalbardensis TaxID=2972972 RepID=A0ABT6DG06_9BACT|nr:TIGR02147 family protein [Bdellovibrio svalbardensis]MDG0815783.1 TIGR02147 family protein [Bdellovibrio svalbardensis]